MSIRYKIANWIRGRETTDYKYLYELTRNVSSENYREMVKFRGALMNIYDSLEGQKSGTAVRIRREIKELL